MTFYSIERIGTAAQPTRHDTWSWRWSCGQGEFVVSLRTMGWKKESTRKEQISSHRTAPNRTARSACGIVGLSKRSVTHYVVVSSTARECRVNMFVDVVMIQPTAHAALRR